MQDDPLPGDDQARFDALPRAIDAPPHLEDRVVRELHARGVLRSRPPRRAWLQVAAALLLVVSGFAIGRLTAAGAGGTLHNPERPARTDNRYLLLLYGAHAATATEEAARVAEYGAWARDEGAAGRLLAGEKLGDASTAIGSAGPTPPSPLDPSGFFIIRAATADDARAIASRCPHVKHGGTVVIRPIE
jgi:hypothetical protein